MQSYFVRGGLGVFKFGTTVRSFQRMMEISSSTLLELKENVLFLHSFIVAETQNLIDVWRNGKI